MNTACILALSGAAVSAVNPGTLPYNFCDKKAVKRCVSGYCCSSNLKKDGDTVVKTATCMPNGSGATSVAWTDNLSTTPLISGGVLNDKYTYSCNSHSVALIGASLTAAAATVISLI